MVRALSADGYGQGTLARESGLSRSTLAKVREGADLDVLIESWVADRLRTVYRRLSRRTPDPGAHTLRARGYAAARGWVSSAAWSGVDMADPDSRPRVDVVDAA